MKTCTYCGKEYGDHIASCPIDGQPVETPGTPAKAIRKTETLNKTSKPDVIGGLVIVLIGLAIGAAGVGYPIHQAKQHVKGTIVVYLTLLTLGPYLVLFGLVRAVRGQEEAKRLGKEAAWVGTTIGIVLCSAILVILDKSGYRFR